MKFREDLGFSSLDFMSFKVLMLLSLVWIPQETAAKPVQILYGVFDIIPLIATDVPMAPMSIEPAVIPSLIAAPLANNFQSTFTSFP